MWFDAQTLHEFYLSSFGYKISHLISDQLQKTWLNLSGKSVLGLGYALPYLEDFKGKAERRLVFFPEKLGSIQWCTEQNQNRSALVSGHHLPLRDNSIDRVLMIHALNYTSASASEFLGNVWRLLTDSGRIIVVVPNRLGTWSQFEGTPFGQESPYTSIQLSKLLIQARFHLSSPHQHALFAPPKLSKSWPQLQNLGEKWGGQWIKHGGGVLIQEAEKKNMAKVPEKKTLLTLRALQKKRQFATPV